MEISDFGIKIAAAVIAGLLIGVEREFKSKGAGVKTNALVALGAAVFVLVSLHFENEDNVDITRVMGQVVTGIGFIGAGVILQRGSSVSGLTTAATVWCSAGAGCLAAVGEYHELMLFTALIVFINVIFGLVERFIHKNDLTVKNKDEE